jgi:hypothetical protein
MPSANTCAPPIGSIEARHPHDADAAIRAGPAGVVDIARAIHTTSDYHSAMIEKIFAALVFAVCAVLFVRLFVSPRRRARLDAAVQRGARHSAHSARALLRWRSTRREATQAAAETIRRAQGKWDGNVYHPDSFDRPPRKLH